MAYKSLSTFSMTDGPDALEAAIACARLWSAHLDVTCIAQSWTPPAIMFAPEMGIADQTLVKEATDALDRAEARHRKRLEAESFGWALRSEIARSADTLRAAAVAQRFADLAVLPVPGDSGVTQEMLESVLYNSRVPVLLMPEGAEPRFERVVLAWDESDVALAAVRAALPLLKQAGSVGIVTIDPDSETSGHDLAVMLDRRGIAAPVTPVASSGRAVPEVLRDHARDVDADLIVMGAYGNRRLRDIVLGGVSRAMLRDAPVPLLVAR